MSQVLVILVELWRTLILLHTEATITYRVAGREKEKIRRHCIDMKVFQTHEEAFTVEWVKSVVTADDDDHSLHLSSNRNLLQPST